MPDTPVPPPPKPVAPTPSQERPPSANPPGSAAPAPGHVPMSEEFDSAKWTLPPIVPVLIAAAVVAAIVAVVAFTNRPKPVVTGTIVKLATADQEGNTMVAMQVKLDNVIEKQLWIKNIDAELETADGAKFTDHAAPSGEMERYFKAFPALKAAEAEPLKEELKIPAGTSFTGALIFSYAVDQKAFAARKSLTVRIQMYDQPTLELKERP